MWALSLSGCRLGVRRQTRDRAGDALRACDAALVASVPDAAALDGHLQCLLEADGRYPDDGRLYAAVARDLHARALAWPDPARDDLVAARTWALRCLALRVEVAGRLESNGGRLDPRAVERVPAEDAACLSWATITWARWLQQRGAAGAGIDLEVLLAMGDRAVTLAPEADGGLSWWARGLARGVVPAALAERFPVQDQGAAVSPRDAAGADLTQARSRASDRLLLAVTMAELVYGPDGDAQPWRRTLEAVVAARGAQRGLDAIEDAAAQHRAARLLEEGPPAPDAW